MESKRLKPLKSGTPAVDLALMIRWAALRTYSAPTAPAHTLKI